jgi:hypothetical protein
MKHLLSKNCKFVFWSCGAADDSAQLVNLVIATNDLPLNAKGYRYGVDYVILGWLGGGEAAVRNWAIDIWKQKSYDYSGTPLSQLPLMSNVHSAPDFNFWVIYSKQSTDVDLLLRTIQTFYGLTPVCCCPASDAGSYLIYVNSRQIQELLFGPELAAEYEKMLNMPGFGLKTIDALSIMVLMSIFFLVLCNIPLLARKMMKKPIDSEARKT